MKGQIRYNNFKGFNLATEPTQLPPGFLVDGSKNIDLFRQIGALSKRRGTQRQIAFKTDTGAFAAHDIVGTLSSGNPIGQTFTMSNNGLRIDEIVVVLSTATNNAPIPDITVTVYDSVTKDNILGSGTLMKYTGLTKTALCKCFFSPELIVTPSTQYYFELSISGEDTIDVKGLNKTGIDIYDGGSAYFNGVEQIGVDLYFAVRNESFVSGGAVKGLHTYRRSSGDVILFKHDNDLYKLSSTDSTITKTETEDFDEGTLTNAEAHNKSLRLGYNAEISNKNVYFESDYDVDYLNAGSLLGQVFTTTTNDYVLDKISIYCFGSWDVGENIILTLYDGVSKTTTLGTATVNGPQSNYSWVDFDFSTPIAVSPSTSYYFELSLNTGSVGFYSRHNVHASDCLYYNGAASDNVLSYRAYFHPFSSSGNGVYTVDLGNIPVNASLAWNQTEPANTNISWSARGSDDNVNWNDWQSVEISGDGITLNRYIQVKISLSTEDTNITPSVEDFTITYGTGTYNKATSIKGSLSGNRFRAVDYNDICYWCEGGRPYRYDGTTVSSVGVDVPATAPTIAAGAGTGLTGDYYAKVTYVNKYGAESNASAESTKLTVADNNISWSNIPVSSSSEITSRKLYRTKAGGSIYYYVTTINDNTTTTYTDSTIDDNLLTELETDNNIPPNSSIVYEHLNYMFYVSTNNPERIYFSKPGLPDNVPSLSYKAFPGRIKAVKTYQNALIVGGNNFTSAIFGNIYDNDPSVDNTYIKTISEQYGPLSHESVAECFSSDGDVLFIPTRRGLNYLTPGLQENSLRNLPLSWDVQPIFDNAVNRDNISAIYSNNKYIIAMTYYYPNEPTNINNVIMVYDLRTKQWSPPWTIGANCFTESNSKIFFGSPAIGQIYELNSGSSDDGKPIESVANIRPEYTQLGPHEKKRLKKIWLASSDDSDTTDMQIVVSVDGEEQTITPGNFNYVSDKLRLSSKKGHQFAISIKDNSTNDWSISEVVTEYRGRDN